MKAIAEFRKANSVAIISPNINTIDKATSMIALAKICLNKQKSVQILCPKIPKAPINNMFKEEGLAIVPSPSSQDYVVSVDYSSGNIEKVICKRDESRKKFNVVITPKDDMFNFDNVELISGGSSFDMVFSIGLNHINNLDEDFRKVFEDTTVVSLSRKDVDFAKFKFLLNGEKSYSEVIYEFTKAFSDRISEDILNILLQGVISKYKLLENGNNDGWLLVNKFVKYGADFNKALRGLYYSKDYENFQLQKKVFDNIRIDKENRVVWSKVALMMDIDSSNLDIKGRIPFNISKDFDMAFIIYRLDGEKVKVVFESNEPEKYSALELKRVFSCYGSKSRVVITNKDMSADDFEKKFFETICSLFGVSVL